MKSRSLRQNYTTSSINIPSNDPFQDIIKPSPSSSLDLASSSLPQIPSPGVRRLRNWASTLLVATASSFTNSTLAQNNSSQKSPPPPPKQVIPEEKSLCELTWDNSLSFPTNESLKGRNIHSLAVGSDGTIYAIGNFKFSDGELDIKYVAKYIDKKWHPLGNGLGNGLDGIIRHVCVVQGSMANTPKKTQDHVFISGRTTGKDGETPRAFIAQLIENTWVELPLSPSSAQTEGEPVRDRTKISDMLSFKDPNFGNVLVVCGRFNYAGHGNKSVNNITMWTGKEWLPLGMGIRGFNSGHVNSLVVDTQGEKPTLIAGGNFSFADRQRAINLARWDGNTWQALSSKGNIRGEVYDLAFWDDGTGLKLYATGNFSKPKPDTPEPVEENKPTKEDVAEVPNKLSLGRLNDETWVYIEGAESGARKIAAINTGPFRGLYTSGAFSGKAYIARFDGTSIEFLKECGGRIDCILATPDTGQLLVGVSAKSSKNKKPDSTNAPGVARLVCK